VKNAVRTIGRSSLKQIIRNITEELGKENGALNGMNVKIADMKIIKLV
jgi:hypothetical protein